MLETGSPWARPRPLPPLLDRDAELEALGRAARTAATGEGRIIVVEGGPGAGKTRLLNAARALCAEADLRVLSARGAEMEREYPYGTVRQLFEAALLGPEGAGWLAGPGAAASSVFSPDATIDAAAFATLNGLFWTTANAAAERPLALIVDDLHWVDRPSLGFLQFLARRLDGLAVLLVVAGRPAETDSLADLADSAFAEVLTPAPFSQAATLTLTEELLGVRPADSFAAACREASGGNPLLLVELLRTLRSEAVVPDEAHVGLIDHVAPSAVSRVVLLRLRRLAAEVIAVAQAIAVLGSGAEPSLVAELAEVDEATVTEAVVALVGAEVIDAEPPLGFVHPIVRDVIYHELGPDDRDRRHARAAELLHARAAEPDQAGAHLLLASPRGERWIVEVLKAAAADASHRGAVESAITFLRRALAERPADADIDLLYRLGLTEAAVDPLAAVEHLRSARRVILDDRRAARLDEMVARMLTFLDPAEAVRTARRTRLALPERAEDLRAGLMAIEHYAGRFTEELTDPVTGPRVDSPRGRMLMAVQAWERFLSGGNARECADLAATALGLQAGGRRRPGLAQDTLFTAMVAGSVLIFADDRRADDFWEDWYHDAIRSGRAHALIAAGSWHGLMQFRLGRLADAEAAIRAMMEGSRDWGPGTDAVPDHTRSTLTKILIERGDLAGARAALEPASRDPETSGESAVQCRVTDMQLLIAEGRHEAALAAVEPVLPRLASVTNPAWAPWRSCRGATLAQLGRHGEARALVAEEVELARHWGTPGPIGHALTIQGTIEDSLELLEQAVEETREQPFARLEHAKALFALGSAVRRRGQPKEARAFLRDAQELAARCDAHALARQARDELAAAGGRPRASAGSGAASLTASERRVAELAAAGRSNRDIAQQLYLSPKTVEVHLSNSYRKLGIRARRELGSALEAPR